MPSHDLALLAGTDLASAGEVAESIRRFGDRYLERVFTPGEVADAAGPPAVRTARLAARFAAKEAVIKALDHDGPLDWRSIEVVRTGSGRPEVVLHGPAAEQAARRSVGQLAVSLTHHGDLACAVVVAWGEGRSAGSANPNETTGIELKGA